MKKGRKSTALVLTSVLLAINFSTISVVAVSEIKVDEKVRLCIDSGTESIEVSMLYKDIPSGKISIKARELSFEYADGLDREKYNEEEIIKLRDEYFIDLNNKMLISARKVRTDAILEEIGVDPDNAVCADFYPRIICTLTSEQFERAEKCELITRIVLNSDWKTAEDLGLEGSDVTITTKPESTSINSLSQLVSDDPEFSSALFIYSDKYKFSFEYGEERNTLVVYGIPEEDCYGAWRNHVITNDKSYTYSCVDWFPAGANRSVYSGYEYSGVRSLKSGTISDKPLDVRFFVNNEIPYMYETVEEASDGYGYDISPYIYGNDTERIYGDLDGNQHVDMSDLSCLSLYLLRDIDFDDNQKIKADVTADGIIDICDFTRLKQYVSGIIGSL